MNGEHAVIVGGSSGIGLALAKQMAETGGQVTIASRSQQKIDAAQADIEEKTGVSVSTSMLDASNESEVIRFFKKSGKFDHLVSTIKPTHVSNKFIDAKVASHKAAFDAKYWGQYYLALHALRFNSVKQSITFTSGIAAARGYPGFSGTAAINGAIESLVKSLALEVAPIRVNAVSPGFIERYENDNERSAMVDNLGANIPLQRLGSNAEAAEAFRYLMKNNYTSGTVLTVDGGELCG